MPASWLSFDQALAVFIGLQDGISQLQRCLVGLQGKTRPWRRWPTRLSSALRWAWALAK
jgi:hypothetical protein